MPFHDRSVASSWTPRMSVLWGIMWMYLDSVLRSAYCFANPVSHCHKRGCPASLIPTWIMAMWSFPVP